jgi:23S rRNA pseudouridine1911/1915/1917 synthase
VDNAGTPADLRARIPALLEQLTALRQQAQDDILRQVTACWQA